jgi:hypothetical protein
METDTVEQLYRSLFDIAQSGADRYKVYVSLDERNPRYELRFLHLNGFEVVESPRDHCAIVLPEISDNMLRKVVWRYFEEITRIDAYDRKDKWDLFSDMKHVATWRRDNYSFVKSGPLPEPKEYEE